MVELNNSESSTCGRMKKTEKVAWQNEKTDKVAWQNEKDRESSMVE